MAKITYKNGSIELDSEIVELIRDEKTSDKILKVIDKLVELEKSKEDHKSKNIENGTNSLNKFVDTVSKSLDIFFDGKEKDYKETSIDLRTDKEFEEDLNKNFTFGKEEIPLSELETEKYN